MGRRKPHTPRELQEQHNLDQELVWRAVETDTYRFALSLFAELAQGEGPADACSAEVPAVREQDAEG